MDELLAAYPKQVRLVFKNLPLDGHKDAPLAAEAALAAHEQGRFWAMADRLFANQGALGPEALEEHAAKVGLDLERFRAALEERRFRHVVEQDARTAKAAGIHGTPTALINGRKLHGAWQLDAWKSSVDRELSRARGLPVGEEPLPAPRPLEPSLEWPPPRLAIPDELLGERLAFAIPTGDAPSLGAARAPVEVLYFFSHHDGQGGGWGKRMVDHLRGVYGNNLRIVARSSAPVGPARPRGSAGGGGGLDGPRAGQVLADARQAVLPEHPPDAGIPRAGRRRDRPSPR